MTQIIRIGMDTSKHFYQLHGVDEHEQPVLRRKLRRKEMEAYFAKLSPTVVGLEACGGSHHWARVLQGLGHQVNLLAPQLVKPYVKRNKNDAADAAGVCEAMSRPSMRFVPVKTPEQQAALMLMGLRDRLIRSRTQLSNAIRGHATEFGLIAAQGLDKIEPLLASIAEDERLPGLARELFALQGEEFAQLQARLKDVNARLAAWHRSHAESRRVATIPGIGPMCSACRGSTLGGQGASSASHAMRPILPIASWKAARRRRRWSNFQKPSISSVSRPSTRRGGQ